ncbi:MAG TPA: hypothetical protein VJ571_04440, partial [Candidatus Nitrosotalea sp.]|nr:hypothetical protein [Candidatus Nitrosotalea sp.]
MLNQRQKGPSKTVMIILSIGYCIMPTGRDTWIETKSGKPRRTILIYNNKRNINSLFYHHCMVDNLSKEKRSKVMASIKNKNTMPELIIR